MSKPSSRPALAAISSNNRVPNPHPAIASQRRRYRSMDEVTVEEEEQGEAVVTQSSLSISDDSSNISNLSLLSDLNLADDLDRRMLDYARLKQTRWTKQSPLENEPVRMQAFKKARTGAHFGANGRHEVDYDNGVEADGILHLADNRPASPNIPRQWGRKGRQRNEFLQRLNVGNEELHQPPDYNYGARKSRRLPDHGVSNAHKIDATDRDPPLLPQRNSAPKEMYPTDRSYATDAANARPISRSRRQNLYEPTVKPPEKLFNQLQNNDSADTKDQNHQERPQPSGSRELLQRLARATSRTPSPTRRNGNISITEPKSSIGSPNVSAEEQLYSRRRYNISSWNTRETRAAESRKILASKASTHKLSSEENEENAYESLDESSAASIKDPGEHLESGDLSEMLQADENTLDLIRNVNIPLKQNKTLRVQEKKAMHRMIEILTSVPGSMRDVSRGVMRMTKQFGGSRTPTSQSEKSLVPIANACPHCGCSGRVTVGDVVRGTWESARSCFYSWPNGGKLRFTWLGLLVAIFLLWSFTELTLCEYHCHPLYAKSMIGYGVDIRRPRMPYVTTTILIKRPLKYLAGPFSDTFKQFTIAWATWILSSFRNGKPDIVEEYRRRLRAFERSENYDTSSRALWHLNDPL